MKKLLLSAILLIIWVNISISQTSWGTQIGTTCYDLQTNSAIRNGLVSDTNGTVAVVWTQNLSCTSPQPDQNDRGIGYACFDGNTWSGACLVPHGCASQYVGWPNIVWCGSGKECIIGHTLLNITCRSAKCSGAWNTTTILESDTNPFLSSLWPRAVADGNFIHIIALHQGGIPEYWPFLYHRSSDCGVTWDITRYMLPNTDSLDFQAIGSDSYAIDARNGAVAITTSVYETWVMWKSVSNGDTGTWAQTIIAPFDTTGTQWMSNGKGNVWTYDDAHAVTLNNNGMAHASVGQIVLEIDSLGQLTGFSPLRDTALYYWNENMAAPIIAASLVDLPNWFTGDSADGDPSSGLGNDFPNYYLGVASMSQISIDQNNNPYIVYSGMVEWTSNTGDTSGQSFRDLYLVYSSDGGNTWSKPINIAGEIAGVDDGSSGTRYEEDVYPMTNKIIGPDNLLHIVWQMDTEPGTELQDDDSTAVNYIMHYSIVLDSFITSIPETQNLSSGLSLTVYPNPFNKTITIQFQLPENNDNAQIDIYEIITGRIIKSLKINSVQAQITFDNSIFTPGIYVVQLKDSGGIIKTAKIVYLK